MRIPKASVNLQLKILEDLGIIYPSKKGIYKSNYRDVSVKKEDPSFERVRTQVYEVFYGLLMRNFSMEKKQMQLAHRFSFTFRPSETNVKIIYAKLQEVESLLQQIPDEGDKTHSLMVLFSDILDQRNALSEPEKKPGRSPSQGNRDLGAQIRP